MKKSRIILVCAMLVGGCKDSSAPGATLDLTTTANFSGTVTKNEFESGITPAGFIEQNDLWIAIPPSKDANVGVVIGKNAPVFRRDHSGNISASTPSAIRVGDLVEVWHDDRPGFGAVQAPPGSPVYSGLQIVINK